MRCDFLLQTVGEVEGLSKACRMSFPPSEMCPTMFGDQELLLENPGTNLLLSC
jgi:hypothetical protein